MVRFGPNDADLVTGELRKRGRRVLLQEQPFQALVLLLERPGQLVTREELQKKLWPDGAFVDFDRGLNKAINRLREVLSDDADQPRYIETLPQRGYRFIGTLETVARAESALPAPVADPAGPGPLASPQPGRRTILAIIAAVSVAGFLGIRALRSAKNFGGESAAFESIAVLPLERMNGILTALESLHYTKPSRCHSTARGFDTAPIPDELAIRKSGGAMSRTMANSGRS